MDVVDDDGRRGTKRKYSGDNGRVPARAQTPGDVTTSARQPPFGCASTDPSSFSSQPEEEIDEKRLDARERHFATLYATELDFRRLGERDEALRALLGGKGQSHLDFTDPRAVMQLTKTLLRLDFGLRIELPPLSLARCSWRLADDCWVGSLLCRCGGRRKRPPTSVM